MKKQRGLQILVLLMLFLSPSFVVAESITSSTLTLTAEESATTPKPFPLTGMVVQDNTQKCSGETCPNILTILRTFLQSVLSAIFA